MVIIDYSRIRSNLLKLNNKFGLVLKNDAYGVGINKLIKYVDDLVDFYAVINISEALYIRSLTNKRILLLEYSPLLSLIKENNLIPTAKSYKELELYEKNKLEYEAVFDVGMNRFGFREFDESIFMNKHIRGIYAHIPYFSININDKLTILNDFRVKYNIDYHVGGSMLINKNDYKLRIGLYAFSNAKYLYGRVIDIRIIDKGERIGYDGAYVAKKSHLYGILDIGYKNGISTNFKGYGIKNNRKYNVLGKVCMNNTFIELDSNIKIGDYVEFLGDNISLKDFARMNKLSEYESFLSIK